MNAINDTRVAVWKKRGEALTGEVARIDADGVFAGTLGECKEELNLNYKGAWGYHPLVVSLANTQEPLFVVNRSGNRPSAEGAVDVFDKAIALCRRGGSEDILLRGDTDFSLTRHFDSWTQDGVRFVFGYDASKLMVARAQDVREDGYAELSRKVEQAFEGKRRAKQPRIKEAIVRKRGYLNQRLESEELAELEHNPNEEKLP